MGRNLSPSKQLIVCMHVWLCVASFSGSSPESLAENEAVIIKLLCVCACVYVFITNDVNSVLATEIYNE